MDLPDINYLVDYFGIHYTMGLNFIAKFAQQAYRYVARRVNSGYKYNGRATDRRRRNIYYISEAEGGSSRASE